MHSDDDVEGPESVVGILFEPAGTTSPDVSGTSGQGQNAPRGSSDTDTEFIASVLAQQGIIAGLLDGALVGAPGWVLVRTVQFDDGTIGRWTVSGSASDRLEHVGMYDLRSSLEAVTGRRVQIGATLTMPNGIFGEGNFSGTTADWVEAETIVGRWSASDGPMMANAFNEPLWFAPLPCTDVERNADKNKMPFAVLAPADPFGFGFAFYGAAAWSSNWPVLSFNRYGPWREISVLARNGVLHAVTWGPAWKVVDPSGSAAGDRLDPLVEEALERLGIGPDDGDPADLAAALAPRRRLWRRSSAREDDRLLRFRRTLRDRLMPNPFDEVAAALGIPSSIVPVADGRVHPRQLPDAKRHEVEGIMRAAWKSTLMESDEPGLTNWMYRKWIDRPWHYWVYSLLLGPGLTCVAAIGLNSHDSKWPTWLLWTAIAFGIFTTADMLVPRKWRGLFLAT